MPSGINPKHGTICELSIGLQRGTSHMVQLHDENYQNSVFSAAHGIQWDTRGYFNGKIIPRPLKISQMVKNINQVGKQGVVSKKLGDPTRSRAYLTSLEY